MKKLVSLSLAPNTQIDDVLLSLKNFFWPWLWQKGKSAAELENKLRKYFQIKSVFCFAAGRTALWAALKAAGVGPGDEVLLQSFTCVVVAEAILALGAEPVWVDIDKNSLNISTEDLAKKINSKAKAIIVQHTFGFPADLDKIISFSRRHHLVVIEDCAQALGVEYQGKKLGKFGDMAVISFGRDKTISSVFGGAVITKNQIFGENLRQIQKKLPHPPLLWIGRHLLYLPVHWAIAKTYYLLNIGKSIHWFLLNMKVFNKAVFPEEKKGKLPSLLKSQIPNSFARLALHQLKKLEAYNQKRYEVVKKYRQSLISKEPTLSGTYPLLRFPVLINNPRKLIGEAKSKGLIIGDWYRPAISPRGVDYRSVGYHPELCPVAEKVAKRIVNLPTSQGLKDSDIDSIIKLVNKYGDQTSRR